MVDTIAARLLDPKGKPVLTTRELAAIILIGVALLLVFAVPKWRGHMLPSISRLVKAALSWRIVLVFGLFTAWCAGWVVLGSIFGYWDFNLVAPTIITVLTVGFPLLFRSVKADTGGAIVRQIGGETITLSAILLFYLNLETFPLWFELILQPVLGILFALAHVAGQKEESKKVQGCLNVLLALVGLAVLVWTSVQFFTAAGTRDWNQTIREFALSIWLPLVMFPYFYATTFFAAAETATMLMRRIWKPPANRRAVLAAVLGLHFSIRWAREFKPIYEKPVARSKTFRVAVGHMRDFRDDVERRRDDRVEREAHLVASAGQLGTDGTGAQLDRREFEGTKRALDFLHTCEMGWFGRLGNRYWDDRTEVTLRPLDRWNLPDPHGIQVEISQRGQVWRAWRRMPSTSYLGIGGRDGEPDTYHYAGPTAPIGWPGDDEWMNTTFEPDLLPDWARDDDLDD